MQKSSFHEPDVMAAAAAANIEALGFKVFHLSPTIGTEVHGVNLTNDLGDEVTAPTAEC